MASPVEAQIILCDAAVADPSGKVHMLGAGWSVTGTPTAPQAVAVLMKIPWDRANQRLPMALRLLDADGTPVSLDGPDGPQVIESRGEVEVGRPPGLAPGSPIDASFALNVQSMPLQPGRYEWRLELADQTFGASFQVRNGR
jgi:uncharacterized protein DUF6941